MTTATLLKETPRAVVHYEFSYSRSSRSPVTGNPMMRFRYKEDGDLKGEWLVDQFVGAWRFLWTDRKTGVLHVECYLRIKHLPDGLIAGEVFVAGDRPPDIAMSAGDIDPTPAHDHSQCVIASSEPFPQGRETHWRLCYAREIAENQPDQPCWRLRDERSEQLWFVHDYRGVVNVNYLDHGSHIFVDMPATVDENGIAFFMHLGKE